jgi:hypothetical protein
MNILEILYPANEIFVKNFIFNDDKMAIEVECLIPSQKNYTKKLVPYVTTENYVRCLSQTSYLLAHHLVKEKILSFEIDEDEFIKAMANYDLYYRNLAMTFHYRTKKDEGFKMILELKNVREIKNLNNSLLFVFSNKRTVISGEMSFIYVK